MSARLTGRKRDWVCVEAHAWVPVIHDEGHPDWLQRFNEADRIAKDVVEGYGLAGKHLNSLAWRIARRFGSGKVQP